MKPKKKDRVENDESKAVAEKLQADHELFLQAFEKPTQIYRYLRTRNIISPIFLQRTLHYMRGRCKRKRNTRTNFKVDSILEMVEAKFKKKNVTMSYKPEFLNVLYTGFFDKDISQDTSIEVETFLMKISHKKRKDVSSPTTEVSMGSVKVPGNPDHTCVVTPSKTQVISVASENFNHSNGHHSVKSYVLVVRVRVTHMAAAANGDKMCNGTGSDVEMSELTEMLPPKRSRHSLSQERSMEVSPTIKEEAGLARTRLLGAELTIYDRHRRCMLTDGDYELCLQDMAVRSPRGKQATWETVMDGKAVGPFEVFSKCPTVKFKLSWNKGPLPNELPPGQSSEEYIQNNQIVKEMPDMDVIAKADKMKSREALTPSKRKRIFYQFLYNNNTRQQTEARDDLHCPWCSLNCNQLYPLLKHLRVCHARFNFTYMNVSFGFQEHPKGSRIDVSINECYDGSYVGNPQDLHSHIGYAFSRNGPVRRTPITNVLVYRPEKSTFDLAEFLEPETDTRTARQIVQGHNRLYYHIETCRPVMPAEIEIDSDAENDPEWLQQKTINMIDEFTDVNEGEKEVMKMWNLHVMHNNYRKFSSPKLLIGDCQLPQACATFVEEFGPRVLRQNLTHNWLLHLSNLYDFGLLKPDTVYRTTMQLLRLRDEMQRSGELLIDRPLIDLSLLRRMPEFPTDLSSVMERIATNVD